MAAWQRQGTQFGMVVAKPRPAEGSMTHGDPHWLRSRVSYPNPRLGGHLGGVLYRQPATFSYGDERAWKHLGWHEIERGSWNAELNKLSWVPTHRPARPSPRRPRARRAWSAARSVP